MTVAFVTGITGQDGSYLAEDLTQAGIEVHGLFNSDLPEPNQLPESVIRHLGDLADPAGLARLLTEIQPDLVFNLAGITSVAQSWNQPILTAQLCGLAAVQLIDSAFQLQESVGKPVKFLQASSSEIFGNAAENPQTESTQISPVNPYGVAKAMAHQAVWVYRQRGLHASNVILYNHESPRRPETFVTRKITKSVAAIAAGSNQKLSLGNLTAKRDWGWAPEYVRAMQLVVAHEISDDYIIATGESHSIEDFVIAAFAAVGISNWQDYVETDPALVRPIDQQELRGDPSYIANQLGWKAEVSFTELVQKMIAADTTQ